MEIFDMGLIWVAINEAIKVHVDAEWMVIKH